MLNKKYPEVSEYEAEEILQEIFRECYVDSSSIPVEQISLYSNYRMEKLTLQRTLATILFILFLILPVFFACPKFDIKEGKAVEAGSPSYVIEIKNLLPIHSVVAVQENRSLPVYQKSKRSFVVSPIANGKMTVELTLFSRQWIRKTIEVTDVDDTGPQLVDTRLVEGRLFLYFTDENGVDYSLAYFEKSNGEISYDIQYDMEQGYFSIVQPDEDGKFHVFDNKGNEMSISLLTSK